MLALQRTAGNRAVCRMLQRTPAEWASDPASQAIQGLKKGKRSVGHWAEIQRLTAAYGGLKQADVAGRRTTLDALEQKIAAWRTNQQTATVWNTKLVAKKRVALANLESLIAREWGQLNAPAPAAQPSRGPAPPPRQQPQPQQLPTTTASTIAATNESYAPGEEWEEFTPDLRGRTDQMFAFDDELEPDEPEYTPPEKEKEKEKEKRTTAEESEDAASDEDEDESEHSREEPASPPRIYAPPAVKIEVHLTKREYIEGSGGIHEQGLIRGRKKGIGFAEGPDQGKPDRKHLYTVDLTSHKTTSYVSQEAGGEPVVVLALSEGMPDANYAASGYGAQMRQADAPPVRNVKPRARGQEWEEGEANALWSFTLPMTPTSRRGLTDFINRYSDAQISEQDAVAMVHRVLHEGMPLHVRGRFPKT